MKIYMYSRDSSDYGTKILTLSTYLADYPEKTTPIVSRTFEFLYLPCPFEKLTIVNENSPFTSVSHFFGEEAKTQYFKIEDLVN